MALWTTSAPSPATATPASASKPSKARKALRPAATTLAMQQPPVHLDACPGGGDSGELHTAGNGMQGNGTPAAGPDGSGFCVCAVSETGEAYVWACGPGDSQGVELQGSLLAQVQVGPQAG